MTFEMHRLISTEVRAAIANNEFPLVLSGNCNSGVIGVWSGLESPATVGVIWLAGRAR